MHIASGLIHAGSDHCFSAGALYVFDMHGNSVVIHNIAAACL